jgi:hypothetical protein
LASVVDFPESAKSTEMPTGIKLEMLPGLLKQQ